MAGDNGGPRKPGSPQLSVQLLSVQRSRDTPLETLAYMGGSRWHIETEFETEKSDVGLNEYEPHTWLDGITTWPCACWLEPFS